MVDLFAAARGHGFRVLDATGAVLYDTAPAVAVTDGEAAEVRHDNRLIGHVVGAARRGPDAAGSAGDADEAEVAPVDVARFVGGLFSQHYATRAVTREALLRYKELTLLYGFASKVAVRSHSIQEAAELIIDEARTLIEGQRFYVVLVQGDELTTLASAGIAPDDTAAMAHAHACARTVVSRWAHSGPDVDGGLTGASPVSPSHAMDLATGDQPALSSDMVIPIRSQDSLIGVLGISSDGVLEYASDEIKLATALALIGAMAIENARYIETTRRFVPTEFLRTLGHEAVPTVSLGDQAEARIAVMFCDIRGFTSLVERLTPQEAFAFINEFLGCMGPVVRRHGGFVDKYLGDAILAIFPDGSCDSALQAAIDAQRTLARFNHEQAARWGAPIQVGCGVHVGRSMLGIIGERERWSGTVISDAVNVAQRVETLTKAVGADILITEAVHAQLDDASRYHVRRLGLVELKGKSEPVSVFDVFDADPEPLRSLKRQTLDDLAAAVAHFERGEHLKVFERLQGVLRVCPDDRVAHRMLSRLRDQLAGRAKPRRMDTIPP